MSLCDIIAIVDEVRCDLREISVRACSLVVAQTVVMRLREQQRYSLSR